MKLSIIIVNYKSGDLTAACLESLLKTGVPEDTEFIVIDNASGDDSVSFLRSDFPEATVIANDKNVGLARAVNQGLKIAKGEYVLLLNPDIIVMPDAVNRLLTYMEKNQKVGVSGGKLRSPNGELQYSCFRFYTPFTVLYRRTPLGMLPAGRRENDRFVMKDFDHASTRDVDWLMGSCLMLRGSALKEVGGMDERFFLYFEDVDWCRRFWEKKWRVVYVPSAEFSHFYQQSSRKHAFLGILTNWTTREHIKSAIKYFRKYAGKPLPHQG